MNTQPQKQFRALLLGDSCKDIYHYGSCSRLSPEAAVPVLKETRRDSRPGMAANVLSNLQSFGIEVDYHTNTETIEKHRYIDERFHQHLLRVDINETQKTQELKISSIDPLTNYDIVVISDYDKGFLSPEVCRLITQQCAENNIPVVVDSKKKDLSCFYSCIMKINQKEYNEIQKQPNDSEFVVTLGSNGARHKNVIYHIVSPVEVFDVCGAGDVFLASLVYGFLRKGGIRHSIPLANEMASISVSHMGTYTLTKEDVEKYHDLCIRH